MVCSGTCMVGAVFLIANIFTMVSCGNDIYKREFKRTLSAEQQAIYEKIINERRNIYYGGFVVGLILSILVLHFGMKYKSNMPIIAKICVITSITFVVNYLFYILYPKTDYMLLHLDNKTQIEGWLAIYKKMQFKFHIGFVLGIISVMIFSYGFCK